MAIEVINSDNTLGYFQFPYMEVFILVIILQSVFDNYINMRQIRVLLVRNRLKKTTY